MARAPRVRPAVARDCRAGGFSLKGPAEEARSLDSSRAKERFEQWLGAVAVLVVGLVMYAWTWRTWPDVLVDFGRELYVPWQLLEGKRLYADIFYFNGPLSPHLNALWFALFGVSLSTLMACNLAIVIGICAGLASVLRRLGDWFTTVLALVIFLSVFAFGHYTPMANYSYLCPYSHEATHGIALGVLGLWCLARLQESGHWGWAAGMGLAAGLSCLTKPEMAVGVIASTVTGLGLCVWRRRGRSGLLCMAFLAALLGSLAAAFGLLRLVLPARQAWHGLLGSWPWILNGRVFQLPFYRLWMGLDDWRAGLLWMARGALLYGSVMVPAVIVGLASRRPDGRAGWLPAACVAVGGALLLCFVPRLWWREAIRALPVLVALSGLGLLIRLLRANRDQPEADRCVLGVSLAVLSLALLSKMALFVRLYNYGFVLAMPATLLAVVAGLSWVPAAIRRWGGNGSLARLGALLLIGLTWAAHLPAAVKSISNLRYSVGSGADRFWADARGPVVNQLLEDLRGRLRPGETLTAVPAGVMINYLLRRPSPVPHWQFISFDMISYGEERLVAAFDAHPPDYIAIPSIDLSEDGLKSFELDYALRLAAWIRTHYRTVRHFRSAGANHDGFEIELLRRDALNGQAHAAGVTAQ